MAIKKKTTVAKSADAARQGAMTKTVVKKVSPDVKIIKAGSKPLTQSLTEKRAIMEKAKKNTPAARKQRELANKRAARENKTIINNARFSIIKRAQLEAMDAAGMKPGKPATPAQVKAGNRAINKAEQEIKARQRELAAERNAKRGQSNKGGKAVRGGERSGTGRVSGIRGSGLGGPLGGGGPFGKIR